MVSCWVRELYFNNERIKTRNVVLMNVEYGSLGSFVSRVRSECVGYYT